LIPSAEGGKTRPKGKLKRSRGVGNKHKSQHLWKKKKKQKKDNNTRRGEKGGSRSGTLKKVKSTGSGEGMAKYRKKNPGD